MLRTNNLAKSYGHHLAFEDVTIVVRPGAILGVIGQSGCGKTSLARCVSAIETFNCGSIEIDSLRLAPNMDLWSDASLDARQKVGIVFQDLGLWPYRTCQENIVAGLCYTKKVPRPEAIAEANSWATKLGIARHLQKYPYMLSRGELQRVALARALVMKPQYLVLDEITSALDPVIAGEVSDILVKLKDDGIGIMLISHQIDFIRSHAADIVFLKNGRVVEQGTASEVLGHPATSELAAFLGAISHGR